MTLPAISREVVDLRHWIARQISNDGWQKIVLCSTIHDEPCTCFDVNIHAPEFSQAQGLLSYANNMLLPSSQAI